MTYFDPPPPQPEHRCQLPAPTTTKPLGWRCTCGRAYVRQPRHQHGETWWDWQRVPKLDHTP